MSGAYMSLILAADRADLSTGASLVLVVLGDFAQPKNGGLVWPSRASIAERAGMGERQVSDHLSTIAAAELITAVKYAKGGVGKSTHYRIELVRLLGRIRDSENRALHLAVLKKIPGALPPGFGAANRAPEGDKPSSPGSQPSSLGSQTESSAATKQVLTSYPGFEPGARAPAQAADASAAMPSATGFDEEVNGEPGGLRTPEQKRIDALAARQRPIAAAQLRAGTTDKP